MIGDYLKPKSRHEIKKELDQKDPRLILLQSARANYLEGIKIAIHEKKADINEWVMIPFRRDELPDLPEHLLPKGKLRQLGSIAMELTTSEEIMDYLKNLNQT
jgi:hypothetical protein